MENSAGLDPLSLAESLECLTKEEISHLRRQTENKLQPDIAYERAKLAEILERARDNEIEICKLKKILQSQCAIIEKLENSLTIAQN